ncbi:MAG: lipoate--protein ligase [Bacteroidales bacterium]
MLLIRSPYTDPWFNLAAEEYLLKNFSEDFYFQYTDIPSVIVGKHQNTLAEINYRVVRDKNIRVARRLTGGGTVYHDSGNLNFSFIMNGKEGSLVDFRRFIIPVNDSLLALGVNTHIGERNDILIGEKKISGNAEHVFRQRTLHHGTLLFGAELGTLRAAIQTAGNYTDKAVKSKRSPVTNILPHLSVPMSMHDFENYLFHFISNASGDGKKYAFSDEDLEKIQKLMQERYCTWDWIFAYSPDYSMEKTVRIEKEEISLNIQVKNGIITSLKMNTTGILKPVLDRIQLSLEGQLLREEVLMQCLRENLFTEKENQVVINLVPELF